MAEFDHTDNYAQVILLGRTVPSYIPLKERNTTESTCKCGHAYT